jgi:hypothetical protein
VNRTGSAEALGCKSRCHIDVVCGSIILFFGFGRRDVADGFEQPTMVELVYPFERVVLDSFEGTLRPAPLDHLGLVKPLIVSAKALS